MLFWSSAPGSAISGGRSTWRFRPIEGTILDGGILPARRLPAFPRFAGKWTKSNSSFNSG
jgi:hypothetical protein